MTVPTKVAPAARRGAVRISLATPADLSAAQALERAAFSTYAITARQMRYLSRSPHAIFLVAKARAALAGDAIALVRRNTTSPPTGRIYSLIVDPAHRGQRIGQKLMTALLKRLAGRGVQRVYLEVEVSNAAAIHLYERLGFQSLARLPHYYGRGKHGLRMGRKSESPNPRIPE